MSNFAVNVSTWRRENEIFIIKIKINFYGDHYIRAKCIWVLDHKWIKNTALGVFSHQGWKLITRLKDNLWGYQGGSDKITRSKRFWNCHNRVTQSSCKWSTTWSNIVASLDLSHVLCKIPTRMVSQIIKDTLHSETAQSKTM